MNTRPFGVGWYSFAPTIFATAERVPSAPTTSGARSSPAAVVTPATRPRSMTSPVTAVCVRTSAPASAAALTRISSSVIRRTLTTGAPVIATTSSTTATPSSKTIRPRTHRGRDLQQRVEDSDPLQHLHARGLDRVRRQRVARKAVLVDHADAQAGAGQHRGQRRAGAARADDDDVKGLAHEAIPTTRPASRWLSTR